MSGTLGDLKKSIEFNQHLTDILGVLKEIAMGEYWRMEGQKRRFDHFKSSFNSFFRVLNFSNIDHPFLHVGAGRPAIVLVTSDEGFSGGINNKVVNEGLLHPDAADAVFIALGSRGAAALNDIEKECIALPGVDSTALTDHTRDLKDFLVEKTMNGEFSRVSIIYAKSVSFVVNRITTLKLLPASELIEEHAGDQLLDERIILESDPVNILEMLVEMWISENLYEIFEDAKLSEYSSRTVHLEESHTSLIDEYKVLRNQYFRRRRSMIDQAMRETFSGMLTKKAGLEKSA